MFRSLIMMTFGCLLAPSAVAQPIILDPPPPEVIHLPDCATAYLYSINNLHYFSTIDCANPFVTGFGVSGGVPTAYGCIGGSCRPEAIVTPAAFKQMLARNPDAISAEMLQRLLKAGCDCDRGGRFSIPNGRRGQVALVKKRIDAIKNDVNDPRRSVADKVLDASSGQAPIELAAKLLRANATEEQQLRARFYLDHVAAWLNSVRVPAGSNTQLSMTDKDYETGFLENRNERGVIIEDGKELFEAKAAGWDCSNAQCYNTGAAVGDHLTYVQYQRKIPGGGPDSFVEAYFRLQKVTKTVDNVVVHTHYVGQQVQTADLPAPSDSAYVKGTPQNVRLVQTQDHVHILRVRTAPNGPLAANSADFLVYSAENLGGRR